MSRRLVHALLSVSLLFGTGALVTATGSVAEAVGAPVMIDDFAGTHGGTRTVSLLPGPGESTTAPGTFAESGGLATMTMNGDGNGRGGVRLSYAMSNVDLTSAGNNTQFFLEFGSIERLPVQQVGETAAAITILVTDANGVTGVYNTGISNVIGFNVVLNFNCSPGQSACFSPQPNFANVTNVAVEVRYPRNLDSVASLETVLDTIRTTPTGGVVPSAPSPQVGAPASPVYGQIGDTVIFDVAFTSTTGPAAVTNNPPSTTGLRAQDVMTRGTAGGRSNVSVSGGPATYQVTLGPLTSTGTLGIDIPAEVVTDAWGQDNVASVNTPTVSFQIAVPPLLNATNPTPFLVGDNDSFQFTSTGLPAPTFDVVGSPLPSGLSLDDDGTLSGTPSPGTRGSHPIQVRATNVAGNDVRTYTLEIRELPFLSAPDNVSFEVGSSNSFTVDFDGYPMPVLSTSGLPAWLTRTDNGPGSATFSGTAPVAAVGTGAIGLTATNTAGVATDTVSFEVTAIETSVAVTADPDPVSYGHESTATATVTSPTPVPGTVQFSVDSVPLGDPVVVVGGQATSPVLKGAGDSWLGAGSHSVQASFTPSSPAAQPSSATTTLLVEQAATLTSLEIHPGTLWASVVPESGGAGTPTGIVRFYLDGVGIGQATVTAGVAELTFVLPAGEQDEVSAEYSGDANFTGSPDSTSRLDPQIQTDLTSRQPLSRFGWYRTPVTVWFTCTEGSAPLVGACPASVRLDTSAADAVVERTIHAADGGIASVVQHVRLDLDKPKVKVLGVRDGAVYAGKAPKPRCVAKDKLSGIASCKITRIANGERVRFRAVATDKAGNTASARGSYRLLSFFVKDVPYRGGAFVVRAGQSYTLVAKSAKQPRYFFAAPAPTKPFARGPLMERAGKNRWVLRIGVTDAMAARANWNVGIKSGGDLRVVRLHIR